MGLWTEVADEVFQRRYNPFDVSVCVVRSTDGLLVVDTRSTPREADELRADLSSLSSLPVRCVVNTHAHFDHCFGNSRFVSESAVLVPIFGHVKVPAHLVTYEVPMLAAWIDDEGSADVRDVVITPPTELVETRARLDVGGRTVELIHLGRGHTDNDLLVHVPDSQAWLVGDLIEESGPPSYGPDSFPLDWPETVGALGDRLVDAATLVPGHGAAITPRFVAQQQIELAQVADLIRRLHAAGVPEADALAEGRHDWPFPVEGLADAVDRGYLQLKS